MPLQSSTDRDTERTGARHSRLGLRLLALAIAAAGIGGILVAIGSDDAPHFIGLALLALAAPPGMAGLALLLAGLTGRRASRHKPFA